VGDDLMRLYFPIQPVCNFLSPATKTIFLEKVNRENNTSKIDGLLEQVANFNDEMESQQEQN